MRTLLALLLLAGTARADKAAADKAKAHVTIAQRMFAAEQYDKAIEELQTAYVLDPKPEYLYALGQAFRMAGDCVKAIRAYEGYLKTGPVQVEADKANANIDRCKADAAAKAPPVPAVVPAPVAPAPIPAPIPPPPPPAAPAQARGWLSDYAGDALVASGVIAIGVGALLYLDGHGTISSIDSAATYDDFAARHADVDAAQLHERIGVTALIAGAALVGGGILHYSWGGHGSSSVSAALAPSRGAVVFTRSF